ncbi:hypothetical protein ACIBEJ_30190 [Nonomuraea sp. NPDC050790]|uniref:hypothetical protein n=1 Tax=Nonomuraea sp. NPDC050790 TaxID=3364371 RepID=UPI003793CEF3
MTKRLAVCGLLGLALLTGCGSAGGNASAPEPEAKDRRHERETLIADCMKQKGFTYVVHVPPFRQSDLEKRVAGGDYASLKEVRSKHGFGMFSRFVYKDEAEPPSQDPNEPVKAGLGKGQREAYEKQVKTCYTSAVKQVFGLEVTSLADFSDLTAKAIEQVDRELNGDAKLNELAGPFAQCLTGKGEKVRSTRPLDLVSRGPQEWSDLVGQKEWSAQAARPYLTREIKAALTDLECGREFYAAFNPLSTRLNNEARLRFGFLPQS